MLRIRTSLVLGVAAGLIAAAAGDPLCAQNIAVQQPVIESFTVNTTVSVPDRGRALIGGMGRGAASRTTYGPFRTNTNFGRVTEGSSVSVHAWIHDFEKLDCQALDTATSRRPPGYEVRLGRGAEHALKALQATDPQDSISIGGPEQSTIHNQRSRPATRAHESKLTSDDYHQRGLKAEAAGKRGVALIYFRLWRDHGSRKAFDSLKRLEEERASSDLAADSADQTTGPSRPTRSGGQITTAPLNPTRRR